MTHNTITNAIAEACKRRDAYNRTYYVLQIRTQFIVRPFHTWQTMYHHVKPAYIARLSEKSIDTNS